MYTKRSKVAISFFFIGTLFLGVTKPVLAFQEFLLTINYPNMLCVKIERVRISKNRVFLNLEKETCSGFKEGNKKSGHVFKLNSSHKETTKCSWSVGNTLVKCDNKSFYHMKYPSIETHNFKKTNWYSSSLKNNILKLSRAEKGGPDNASGKKNKLTYQFDTRNCNNFRYTQKWFSGMVVRCEVIK